MKTHKAFILHTHHILFKNEIKHFNIALHESVWKTVLTLLETKKRTFNDEKEFKNQI